MGLIFNLLICQRRPSRRPLPHQVVEDQRENPFSRNHQETSELVVTSSQRETLPDSSSGQSTSESRDKRESSCSDLSHHQPSTNSPKPLRNPKPQDSLSSSATTHQRPELP